MLVTRVGIGFFQRQPKWGWTEFSFITDRRPSCITAGLMILLSRRSLIIFYYYYSRAGLLLETLVVFCLIDWKALNARLNHNRLPD